MRYAVCRIQKDRVIACSYTKEYNRAVARRFTVVSFEEAARELAACDHFDVVVPAAEVLRFGGEYPPVRRSDLEKIIRQDIETATPFKSDEVVFDTGAALPDGRTPVYLATIDRLRSLLDRAAAFSAGRVRALFPETALASPEGQTLFLDDDTVTFADADGQVVRTGGITQLVAQMREALGHGRSDDEVLQILASSRDLSDPPALSEDELLLRKAAERFFRTLLAECAPYLRRSEPTTLFVADRLPGNAEKIFTAVLPGAVVVPADASLDLVAERTEMHEKPNLARGPFTYRGGTVFLRRRIALVATFFILGLIFMIAAFEVRLWKLDRALDALDERGRQVTKEILGKEYPSLRQAFSTMMKTIEGKGDAKSDKKLYPYSAVFVMEQVFPAAAFEGSSIEVREFSVKDGKVRLSGEADSLEHINTMLENLENLDYVSELNKGQITTRGGKSSFGVGFLFQKKSVKEQARKEKKEKEKEKEKKDISGETPGEGSAIASPPAPSVLPSAKPPVSPVTRPLPGDRHKDTVPWEEEL